MDLEAEHNKERENTGSQKVASGNSLLDILSDSGATKQTLSNSSKGDSFEQRFTGAEHSEETEVLKQEALSILGKLLKPTDSKIACDLKPQIPSAGSLSNTCDIDLTNAFEKVKQSTVKVIGSKQETAGSGFFACSTDKKICGVVTNDHVVNKATDLSDLTIYQEGVGMSKAEVIVQDKKNDLALLRIKPQETHNPLFPPTDLKPVTWANKLDQGEAVFSVCSPTLFTYSTFVSPGKITQTNSIPIILDAPKAPRSIESTQLNYKGCSGGSTFNRFGELVGVVRALNPNSSSMVNIKPTHARRMLDDEAKLLNR